MRKQDHIKYDMRQLSQQFLTIFNQQRYCYNHHQYPISYYCKNSLDQFRFYCEKCFDDHKCQSRQRQHIDHLIKLSGQEHESVQKKINQFFDVYTEQNLKRLSQNIQSKCLQIIKFINQGVNQLQKHIDGRINHFKDMNIQQIFRQQYMKQFRYQMIEISNCQNHYRNQFQNLRIKCMQEIIRQFQMVFKIKRTDILYGESLKDNQFIIQELIQKSSNNKQIKSQEQRIKQAKKKLDQKDDIINKLKLEIDKYKEFKIEMPQKMIYELNSTEFQLKKEILYGEEIEKQPYIQNQLNQKSELIRNLEIQIQGYKNKEKDNLENYKKALLQKQGQLQKCKQQTKQNIQRFQIQIQKLKAQITQQSISRKFLQQTNARLLQTHNHQAKRIQQLEKFIMQNQKLWAQDKFNKQTKQKQYNQSVDLLNLQNQLKFKNQLLENHSKKINLLQEQSKQQKIKLEQAIKQSSSKQNQLQQKLQEENKKYESVQKQLNESKQRIKKQHDTNILIENNAKQIKRLQKQLHQSNSRCEQLNKNITQKLKNIQDLKNQLDKNNENLLKKSNQINQYSKKTLDLQNELNRSKQNLQKKSNQVQGLLSTINQSKLQAKMQFQQINKSLTKLLQEKKRYESVQNENLKLKKRSEQDQMKIQTLTKETSNMNIQYKNKIKELQNSLNQINQNLKNKNDQIQIIKQKLKQNEQKLIVNEQKLIVSLKQLQDKTKICERLQRQNIKVRKQNQQNEINIKQFSKEIDKLHKSINYRQEQFKGKAIQYVKKISNLQNELKRSNQSIDKKSNQIHRLQNKLSQSESQATRQYSQMQKSLTCLHVELKKYESIQNEYLKLKKNSEQDKIKVQNLTKEKEKLCKEIQQNNRRYGQSNKTITQDKNMIKELQNKLKLALEQLQEKMKRCDSVQNDNIKLKKRSEQDQLKIQTLTKNQIRQLQNNLKQIKETVVSKQNQVIKLEKKLKQNDQKSTSIVKKLQDKIKRCESVQSENIKVKKQSEQNQIKIQKLIKEIEKLSKESQQNNLRSKQSNIMNMQYKKKITELQSDLNQIKEFLVNKQNQVIKLEKKLKQNDQKSTSIVKKLQDKIKRCESVQSENIKVKKLNEQNEVKIQNLTLEIQILRIQLQQSKLRQEQSKKKNNQCTKKIQNLQNELKKSNQNVEKKSNQIYKLQISLIGLREEKQRYENIQNELYFKLMKTSGQDKIKIQNLSNQVEKLRKQLNQNYLRYEQSNNLNIQYKNIITELQNNLRKSNQNLEKNQNQIVAIQRKLNESTSKVIQLTKQLQFSVKYVEDLEKMKNLYEHKIAQLIQFGKISTNLLNNQQILILFMMIRKRIQFTKFRLIFVASQHEFSSQKFHKICDNKAHLLVIIKCINGKIFGGYCSPGFGQQQYNDCSFIFSITHKIDLSLKPGKKSTVLDLAYGPIFGMDSDIRIRHNKATSNYHIYNNSYEKKPDLPVPARELLCGQKQAEVIDYEVHQVLISQI